MCMGGYMSMKELWDARGGLQMPWSLQVAVRHPAWAVGTRLWPSAGAEALPKDKPFLQLVPLILQIGSYYVSPARYLLCSPG